MFDESLPEFPDSLDFLGPPPIRIEPHSNVSIRLAERGISRPRLSTVLRKWGLSHPFVRRMDLYHTGRRFCVAVLVNNATIDRIRSVNETLGRMLSVEFGADNEFEIYAVDSAHQDAEMFRRYGAIRIIEVEAATRSRVA